MSLPKLTSISTKTLSLLLEQQRLQTLPTFNINDEENHTTSNLHLPQITKNLKQMRAGILELEKNGGPAEAVKLLKNQFERMRGMVGVDIGIESLESQRVTELVATSSSGASSSSSTQPAPPFSSEPVPSPALPSRDSSEHVYTPYTDNPDDNAEPGIMLQTQRRLMDEQDTQLDQLSHSINRQHHISLQINDELDTHTGLLSELDTDLDRTSGRLSGARKKLDQFARGAKENGSTVTIALLILVLLILIIVFKT